MKTYRITFREQVTKQLSSVVMNIIHEMWSDMNWFILAQHDIDSQFDFIDVQIGDDKEDLEELLQIVGCHCSSQGISWDYQIVK